MYFKLFFIQFKDFYSLIVVYINLKSYINTCLMEKLLEYFIYFLITNTKKIFLNIFVLISN